MDRRKARARILTAATLPFLLAAAADTPALPIKEARWLAQDKMAEGLTREPSECFALPRSASLRRSAAIGRAAFRAPLLLGGQAARVGLSCASCHRNGRGNNDFTFPGLSGHPGTADVTSSLMSTRRGDGKTNPKPIPDLAADRTQLKVSRAMGSDELKRFLRGLIVDEFDGEEPPPAVLEGLTAYVRGISPEACHGAASVKIGLNSRLNDVDAAMRAAEDSWHRGDAATARLLVGAARSILGSIDERFRLPHLETSSAQLHAADAQLRMIQQAIASPFAAVEFSKWKREWPRWKVQLRRQERWSLFSPEVLQRQFG